MNPDAEASPAEASPNETFWAVTFGAVMTATFVCYNIAMMFRADATMHRVLESGARLAAISEDIASTKALAANVGANASPPVYASTPLEAPGPWTRFSVSAYGNECAVRNPVTGEFGPSKTGLTATGTPGGHGSTVAADPKVLPLLSRIRIAGIGEFIVTDSMPPSTTGHPKIDMFLNSCEEAKLFGRQTMWARRVR